MKRSEINAAIRELDNYFVYRNICAAFKTIFMVRQRRITFVTSHGKTPIYFSVISFTILSITSVTSVTSE